MRTRALLLPAIVLFAACGDATPPVVAPVTSAKPTSSVSLTAPPPVTPPKEDATLVPME